MAARELTYFPFWAQPVLRPRFSAVVPPKRVPHLKTQRVVLFLLFPTDLVVMNIHVCSAAMPMPTQMLTLSGQQETGRTLRKV